MTVSFRQRKRIHLALFIFVVFIQVLILVVWNKQSKEENLLSQSIENSKNQNLAFVYTNGATKNYFDAENYFNEYLHKYDQNLLLEYRNSLDKMTVYLDSLNLLINEDKHFNDAVSMKKDKEKEILVLRKELDALLKVGVYPLTSQNAEEYDLNPYNFRKVLNSIQYDSIRIADEVIQKGLITRIGDAIKGKYDIKREELQIYIKMVYGNTKKSGTIEDQMRNIFQSTSAHYDKEFGQLRNTYSNLREKDKELMVVNKKILKNSQDILLFYTESAQQSSKMQLDKALSNIQNKKSLVGILLFSMIFCTILLMLYSFFAYIFEKELAKAKIAAENNVEFKNRLIGMLSHEMRAPLNIISNLSNKLKVSNTDKVLSHSINLMHFTSNSLQITVNQILDFFKNENTTLVLYNSKINLNKEVANILESLKSLAEVKKIDLISHIDPDMKNDVLADNGKIHQLFYNLIGNAIKFTNQGNIVVDCKLTEADGKYRFDVKVKDSGVGIPKEDLDKIFDKYYQSKHYKDQISFGAGLGLSLCKEIIELYNGAITVESEVNEGTTIYFHIFLDKVDASHKTAQSQLIEKFEGRKIKLALVDDDRMLVAIMKKLALKVNFEMADFASADAIKKFLEQETVDLIITDLQIANTSGIELISEIKQFSNENATAPIMLITGNDYISDADLNEIGANEILIKPINKEEFYAKLLKLLE